MQNKNIPAKRFLWLAVALIGILSVTLVVGGVTNRVLGETEPSATEGKLGGSTEEKGRWTVLVAGCDDAAGLTDVLMLVTLDRDSGEVWALQIPRDTYAAYSDGSYHKLNGAVTALGGMNELRLFLEDAFGVRIDRYVRLSPDTFRRAVDAVGGVELTLPEAMDYEDPTQGLSIHLPKGTQTLDGEAAEQFVRYRSGYVRGDLGRMDAQKLFLAALFQKISTTHSPVTLGKLAVAFLRDIETDVTVSDAMMLATELFSLRAENIFLVTAPGSDATATISGASYYVLSSKAMKELLLTHFGSDEAQFDRARVFLNPHYQEFRRIYEDYIPYEVFSVAGMGADDAEKK